MSGERTDDMTIDMRTKPTLIGVRTILRPVSADDAEGLLDLVADEAGNPSTWTNSDSLNVGWSGTGSLAVDLTIRAGADPLDRARVFAPFPVAGGSSISHFDSVARRNLLMEPAINADLTHSVEAPQDLTLQFMKDIGWIP